MTFRELLMFNPILLAALMAWAIAQISKVFIEYLNLRRWNWALVFEAGGMPSSHSAMVSATSLSIGLQIGFDTAIFEGTEKPPCSGVANKSLPTAHASCNERRPLKEK